MSPPALAPGDLAGLDALEVDALVLPLFEARAQPLGVAGNVDWRLSGRIARLVQSGRFAGRPGERVLMTALDRVGARRLLLWGLGPRRAWSDKDALDELVAVLVDAAVDSVAIALPTAPAGQPAVPALGPSWQAASAWARLGPARIVLLDGGARALTVPPLPA